MERPPGCDCRGRVLPEVRSRRPVEFSQFAQQRDGQRHTNSSSELSCGDTRVYLELEIRRVACRSCGKVKRERLDFLADNPLYTKRFAFYVGRRVRTATIQDVARELKLDWHTVKALEKQYMRAQRKRAGTPGPQGHRHRRGFDPQGAYLPYRGQ